MEVAATARDLGAEVTVLEAGPGPYRAFANPELASFFQRFLEARGVAFRTGVRITRFRASEGRLAAVAVEPGGDVPADVAVVGVGAEPNTEWLAASGFQIDRGGVVVNGRLETNGESVWAAGDIARYPDAATRQPRRLEHWDNALWQGKQAGRNLAGAGEIYAHQSLFFSDLFDVSLNVLGETDRPEGVVMKGSTDLKTPLFTAHYLRGNRLTGAVLVNLSTADRTAEFETLQKHLAERTTPDL